MDKIFGLVVSLVSWVITLIVGALVIMALIYGFDWFTTGNNAGAAGSKVHDGGTSIMDFVNAVFGK